MNSISKEYLFLFNTITKAETALRQLRTELIIAQQQAEELFLEETGDSPNDTLCGGTLCDGNRASGDDAPLE